VPVINEIKSRYKVDNIFKLIFYVKYANESELIY